jgi:hypothetical protein
VAESRQVAHQFTWPGMSSDDEADGPLALLLRNLGASVDHAFLTTQAEHHPINVDPLEAADSWARPAAERQMRRNSSRASLSWGFMGPRADTDCSIAGGLDSQHVGHGIHCARYASTTASGYTES